MPEFSEFVVPWGTILAYFDECRERAIADLTRAETERHVWQAQGKLTLLSELCNIKDILGTLDTIGKE